MELAVSQAHGAASVIQERLRDTSDLVNANFCQTCGQVCYYDKEQVKYYCTVCLDSVNPTGCTVPYSFLMLRNYWTAMGISSKLTFSESQDLPNLVKRELKKAFKPNKIA